MKAQVRQGWSGKIELAATTFVTLFVFLDPLGNVPIVLLVTPDSSPTDRRRIVQRASLVAGAVLIVFGIVGE